MGICSFRIAPFQRGIKMALFKRAETITSNKPNMLKGDLLRKVLTAPLTCMKQTSPRQKKCQGRISGGKPQPCFPKGHSFIHHMLHCTSHQQQQLHHQACSNGAVERQIFPNLHAFMAVSLRRGLDMHLRDKQRPICCAALWF